MRYSLAKFQFCCLLLVCRNHRPVCGLLVIKYLWVFIRVKNTEPQMQLSRLLHHPTHFRVWRRASWDPQKALAPAASLHLLSRWAPGERQTPGFSRDTLILCLITSCFLCLFVFLVWFPVLFIRSLVLPCLFCVSRVFLQVTSLLSTGKLMPFVPRNLLYGGGGELLDTCLHVWCTRGKVIDSPGEHDGL